MTEDQQLLYDEFANLQELAAGANRQADIYEQNARDMRTLANGYTDRAKIIATQLGFTC